MRVMLTYDEQDILVIPARRCESVVYEVQDKWTESLENKASLTVSL